MKKLLLLTVAAGLSMTGFAQRAAVEAKKSTTTFDVDKFQFKNTASLAKTTGVGDTLAITHLTTDDTLVYYVIPTDSGYTYGTNVFGDKGFAERFEVRGSDSTMQVIGVAARFNGTVSPASTNNINFKVWSVGPKTAWMGRPTISDSGFPNTVLASRSVSVRSLGIGMAGAPDTTKLHMFTTPTAYLTTSFFIGYDVNYTWGTFGDTLGLYSSQDGERTADFWTITGSDTTINNFNVIQFNDNSWNDIALEIGAFNKLFLFPVVKIGPATTGVASAQRNGFTLYGNYPNPASGNTSIRFGLAGASDVTIEVMDINGRTVQVINKAGLAAGEHTVAVDIANLAVGEYVYLVRTSNGDGLAATMTVIK